MLVVVYDGDCAMCSRFIRSFVKINKNPKLYITDFSNSWVQSNLLLKSDVDSVLFVKEDKVFTYSDAVIHMFASANRYGKLLFLLKLIPRFIRDGFYRWIARNRREITISNCPVPSEKMRKIYLT